ATRENMADAFEVAVLRQDLLAGGFAKAVQVGVEERIIEWPGDGVGAEAEQAEDIAAQLPIADVPRDQHRRLIRKHCIDDFTISEFHEASPVVRMEHARQVE